MMGKKTAQRLGWRRVRRLAALLFVGLVGAAVYINWMNRAADWLPVYGDLMAAGQCDRAEALLMSAAVQFDYRANNLQAEWYEKGICGTKVDLSWAEKNRAWAKELANMARPTPNIWDRQLDRLQGLLNRRDMRVQGAGARFEWRDTWLWALCVERFRTWDLDPHLLRLVIAEAKGQPLARPTWHERAEDSCAEKSISFAQALEDGIYGDSARAEADDWYMNAGVLGSDEAQLTLNLGRLEGRFPLPLTSDENVPEEVARAEARRDEVDSIFTLVFLGHGPAALAAAKLALAGEADHMYADFSAAERDEEIYYYVLIAQYRGEDVSGVLTQAVGRLTGDQRVKMENRLAEATSAPE